MNPITKKTENINGIEYSFHISTESDQKHIKGYIQLLNYEDSFRKLENPSLVLKRILYYHIYSEMKKYMVVKTASIENDTEYHALFEIADLSLSGSTITETVQTENNQEVTLSMATLDSFKDCEESIQSPFGGNSRTLFDENSRDIMNLFSSTVLHIKINDPNHSQNSYSAIIDKAVQTFNDNKFGKAFLPIETERMNCNPKEVQIKYTIMPNGS